MQSKISLVYNIMNLMSYNHSDIFLNIMKHSFFSLPTQKYNKHSEPQHIAFWRLKPTLSLCCIDWGKGSKLQSSYMIYSKDLCDNFIKTKLESSVSFFTTNVWYMYTKIKTEVALFEIFSYLNVFKDGLWCYLISVCSVNTHFT